MLGVSYRRGQLHHSARRKLGILTGRPPRKDPRRERLGNLQFELGLALTRSELTPYRSASVT